VEPAAITAFFIPIDEASRLVGCGRTRFYQELVAKNRVHPVKHGRHTVISVDELRAVARELAIEAGVPAEVFVDGDGA
jgi:hypothetical protein